MILQRVYFDEAEMCPRELQQWPCAALRVCLDGSGRVAWSGRVAPLLQLRSRHGHGPHADTSGGSPAATSTLKRGRRTATFVGRACTELYGDAVAGGREVMAAGRAPAAGLRQQLQVPRRLLGPLSAGANCDATILRTVEVHCNLIHSLLDSFITLRV